MMTSALVISDAAFPFRASDMRSDGVGFLALFCDDLSFSISISSFDSSWDILSISEPERCGLTYYSFLPP